MSKFCLSCGAANPDTANNCGRCGKMLSSPSMVNHVSGAGNQANSQAVWIKNQLNPNDSGGEKAKALPKKYKIWSVIMFLNAVLSVLSLFSAMMGGGETADQMQYYKIFFPEQYKMLYRISVASNILFILDVVASGRGGVLLRKLVIREREKTLRFYIGLTSIIALARVFLAIYSSKMVRGGEMIVFMITMVVSIAYYVICIRMLYSKMSDGKEVR